MEFIKQGCLKRIPKEFIIEMFYMLPQERITNPTFRNKTMAMLNRNNLKRHGSSPVNRVHVAAGGTETGMAAESNKFKITAARASKQGTTKGRTTAMNHFFYILNDRIRRVLEINHFLKMVDKNLL